MKIYTNEITNLKNAVDKIQSSLEGKLENINATIKSLQNDCDDLKNGIEMVDEILSKKMNETKDDVEKMHKYQNTIKNKLREVEDRSRRNNLRIDGIKEYDSESWVDTESKVRKLFREKLELEGDLIIERAHRVGQQREQSF